MNIIDKINNIINIYDKIHNYLSFHISNISKIFTPLFDVRLTAVLLMILMFMGIIEGPNHTEHKYDLVIYSINKLAVLIGNNIKDMYVFLYISIDAAYVFDMSTPRKYDFKLFGMSIFHYSRRFTSPIDIVLLYFILYFIMEYSVLQANKSKIYKEYPQIFNKKLQLNKSAQITFKNKIIGLYCSSLIEHIEILSFLLGEVYAVRSFTSETFINNIIITYVVMPIAFIAFTRRGNIREKEIIRHIIHK